MMMIDKGQVTKKQKHNKDQKKKAKIEQRLEQLTEQLTFDSSALLEF